MKKRVLWILASICLVFLFIWGLVFRIILPNIWNFLIVDETPRASDVIIVLSGDTGRVEYGVKLLELGYADKILFTGGSSGSMRRQAMSLGITDDRILTERRSHSTFENAQHSLTILQEQGFKSAIVVTSAYHTKRASIIFAHAFQGLDLTVCSVPDASRTRDNWWKDKDTATAVVLEYLKLVYHYVNER